MKHSKPMLIRPDSDRITQQYATPNPPHNHVLWELTIYQDGISKNIVNGIPADATSGDIFLMGPAHLHEIVFIKTPHLHQDIYFTEEDIRFALKNWPSELSKEVLSGERFIHLKADINTYDSVQKYCKTLLKFTVSDSMEKRPSVVKALSISLLEYILGLYLIENYGERQGEPKWLIELLVQLQRPEVFSKRVNDIVGMTNYSHSQVSTIFKNYLGVSLVDYLIKIRMSYAEELLAKTNASVLMIAEECGYASLSSFIKLFHAFTGYTPLQYRKKGGKQ